MKKISYAGGTLAHLIASASLDLDPYGANIRTDRMILLSSNITDILFAQ
jgi:hypothetical protein